MTLADAYPWPKAAHVAYALLFVCGIVAGGLLLTAGCAMAEQGALRDGPETLGPGGHHTGDVGRLGFGIGLASAGGWFTSGWLQSVKQKVQFEASGDPCLSQTRGISMGTHEPQH